MFLRVISFLVGLTLGSIGIGLMFLALAFGRVLFDEPDKLWVGIPSIVICLLATVPLLQWSFQLTDFGMGKHLK